MPFTKFTNLDFDQIKTSIKDYLRANSNFTDFDFEGSNFSVLIDTLAYNTYITAFNSNMIVNESFLDSATLRENVVSLARNVGYVPRSRTSSNAEVYFTVSTTSTSPTLTLQAGVVCVGSINETTYIFSIPENITTTINDGVAQFGSADSPILIYQGTLLSKQFTVDGSLDQRFILDNSFIDSSTISVYVRGALETGGLGEKYTKVDNILNTGSISEIYFIQEVQDEKYELLFGDGYFGKKLENNSVVNVSYIVTDGKLGNGCSVFSFVGTFKDSEDNTVIPTESVSVNTLTSSKNGGDIESLSSIKYYAPKLYSSQYRAVTSSDYEAIIKEIYANAESVSIVGGEELSPPRYGKVLISIKPKNGDYVSDFDQELILNRLKNYSVSGINQEIVPLKVLYVEIDTSVYYNVNQVASVDNLKTLIYNTLYQYSKTPNINKFGGRFKYSKVVQLIDNVDDSITSNITKVRIRRNLKALINQFSQYELCFGNKFHINPYGYNIKSTGFYVDGIDLPVYLTDVPNKSADNMSLDGSGKGAVSIVKKNSDGTYGVVVKSAGIVDYNSGEININGIVITSTIKENNIIEVQAIPESNDVIGLKDLYLEFNLENSKINMKRDVISSGEDTSGVNFTNNYYTSSYFNGDIERK
jgi:hypothetical protein